MSHKFSTLGSCYICGRPWCRSMVRKTLTASTSARRRADEVSYRTTWCPRSTSTALRSLTDFWGRTQRLHHLIQDVEHPGHQSAPDRATHLAITGQVYDVIVVTVGAFQWASRPPTGDQLVTRSQWNASGWPTGDRPVAGKRPAAGRRRFHEFLKIDVRGIFTLLGYRF